MVANARLIAVSTDLVDGGSGVRFEVEGTSGRLPAFAIRWHGRVHAYLNVCPHQGSELDWLPGAFLDIGSNHLICATHGALFEPDSGRCVGGPCNGETLVPLHVEETDGDVILEVDHLPKER
jgi:nitrite reductase/ring-hydroxylating ferredoxin subunit